MTKKIKGLVVAMLALGFLAGCTKPPVEDSVEKVYHTVEFYEDNVGKFYKEVEVEDGTKVEKPADPAARKDYEFAGWWVDEAYSAEFSFDTLIKKDTSIYGKWDFSPEYVPDERTFHLVGDLQNTDVSYINWNASGVEGTDWDTKSYLTKAEDSNLYSIEIEIGYLGKFKVKIPGRPWDSDLEFNWSKIKEEDHVPEIQEGDLGNIQVTTAGLYKIEVETTWLYAKVTRLGDATGAGVRQDPAEGEIADWGLVGSINNWGNETVEGDPTSIQKDFSMHYNESGDYYFYRAIFLPEGAEFKLRADNSWSSVFGPKDTNELPASIIQPTEEKDGVTVIAEGGNLKVDVGGEGYYMVLFTKTKIVMQKLAFVLRGNALATGWDTDSAPLTESVAPVVADGKVAITYTGEYEMVAGEFKAKLSALGSYDGWDTGFGGEGGANFVIETAGTYVVTLVVELDLATDAFTGTATFLPKVI